MKWGMCPKGCSVFREIGSQIDTSTHSGSGVWVRATLDLFADSVSFRPTVQLSHDSPVGSSRRWRYTNICNGNSRTFQKTRRDQCVPHRPLLGDRSGFTTTCHADTTMRSTRIVLERCCSKALPGWLEPAEGASGSQAAAPSERTTRSSAYIVYIRIPAARALALLVQALAVWRCVRSGVCVTVVPTFVDNRTEFSPRGFFCLDY